MKYCDLHCDALTREGERQITKENLRQGDCFLQCVAAFVSSRENRFSQALALCDKFDALCKEEGYHAVTSGSKLCPNAINALLTVEEGGAIEGDLKKLQTLYGRGVRMITLTWNYPNEIGYPNFPDYVGIKAGRVSLSRRETERGLTAFGFVAVEQMCSLGVLPDVSHGSDKLFFDTAQICRAAGKPFVASHSGANSVYDCARNLTNVQITTLADCGGVVGLDFCADFLSDDKSAEGQRAALLAHAGAIINAGGEEVLALGSDFDGIPENAYLKNPAYMPKFLDELSRKFGSSAAEKIASGNFLRILP